MTNATAIAPRLVTETQQLRSLVARCMDAELLALDTEGNGLHAFRSKLCALQLGWREGSEIMVAIVDTIGMSMEPLAPLLSDEGPLKLLHDLTFDARMLQEAGITLGHVRDTSVAARFLGEPATGLASLLSTHLGIEVSKKLQDHNWAERPFTDEQLTYLAGDVLYLAALDVQLDLLAGEKEIRGEIEVECAYKLRTALAPPRDRGPAYTRIKGYRSLEPSGRAVLRQLVLERDHIAEQRDVPPFRVAANKLLLELAQRKPKDAGTIARLAGRRRNFASQASTWLRAIRTGLAEGEPPAGELADKQATTISPSEAALRKRIDSALNRWRREAAEERGVDRQVVLPGHCVGPVVSALAVDRSDAMLERLRGVDGVCASRIDRYGDALLDLARKAHAGDTNG